MKYRKQEQEPATEEITEIVPGVLRSQLPVELPGLGHVNCYLLEDERGLAIVDPGLPGSKSFEVLKGRLKSAGYSIDNVHTVLITHSHFDHFGGAERVMLETGADIVTHEYFRVMWSGVEANENPEGATAVEGDTTEPGEDSENSPEGFPFWPAPGAKTPWGTDRKPPGTDEDLDRWKQMSKEELKWFRTPTPTKTIVDTETIRLARREWVAIFTPGHTYDHLCLYDPEYKVMLSGDHVLPTITPHIAGVTDSRDPMSDFFASLRKMHQFKDVEIALPAHGHPFDNLHARADDIIIHHEHRLDIIREAAAELEDGTVVDYMERLFRPRSWGSMAESETFAHLQHLKELGEIKAGEKDGLMTFFLTN